MLTNDVNPKTLSRIELLKLAQMLHVSDADVMTRAELRAAIERARSPEARRQPQPASWLGKARRLLARVVERGLHLPEAATLIRGGLPVGPFPSGPPPVATVTLARIYAAQGHLVRAIGILDEVLISDPDHDLARNLREELQKALDERREQERQRAGNGAPAVEKTGSAAAEPSTAEREQAKAKEEAAAEEEEEGPPSEAQLAASELLGAIPDAEGPGADEITLAGTPAPPAPAGLESPVTGLAEPSVAEPAREQAQEVEAETRRGSGLPLPLAADAVPEPELPPSSEASAELRADSAEASAELRADSAPAPELRAEQASAPELRADNAPPSAALDSRPVQSTPSPELAAVTPRAPGLVLIETTEPSAYLYWELATPALANGAASAPAAAASKGPAGDGNGSGSSEPHWVCVVAHAPRGAGSERREYRFPVVRPTGAVRIEGLPKYAVVRAKLTLGEALESPPLVVAGSVRVGCAASACDGGALTQAQVGFRPHPAADPATLAQRAAAHLANAAPLYY